MAKIICKFDKNDKLENLKIKLLRANEEEKIIQKKKKKKKTRCVQRNKLKNN